LLFLALIVVLAGGAYLLLSWTPTINTPTIATSPGGLDHQLIGLYLHLHQDEIETPAGSSRQTVSFTIKPGETPEEIGRRLQAAGLIKSSDLFKYYVRYVGADTHLEAGDFDLSPNMTLEEIVAKLGRGRLRVTQLTIPEGWRREQTAELIARQGIGSQAEFLRLTQSTTSYSYDYLQGLPATTSLEGFLFPDTYQIGPATTLTDVVRLMLDNFNQRVSPELRQEIARGKLSFLQVITLASIVEREAVRDDERPIIASVYLNRLAVPMILGADSTVQYALGYDSQQKTWWRRLEIDQLQKVQSPYSTYVNRGLPPGPICSPGLASILAAIRPAKTDYLYYHALNDGSGGHVFARTEEEHQANIRKYGR